MKKIVSLILCLLLVTSLCACGQASKPNTTPETTAATQSTEAPATEAPTQETKPAIKDEEALRTALDTAGLAKLNGDVALSREVIVRNGFLDGNGFRVTGPQYDENNPETENAITVTGGTVQNVSVSGAYRGIGDRSGYGAVTDVHLKAVFVDSQSYTLNFGYGNGSANLYAEDSYLRGWTSYTKFGQAVFTNCTFTYDSTGQYGTLRPYINTDLIGCRFEPLEAEDGTLKPFNLSFRSGTDGITVVLEDCYVGETLITQENLNELLRVDLQGNIVSVRNSN